MKTVRNGLEKLLCALIFGFLAFALLPCATAFADTLPAGTVAYYNFAQTLTDGSGNGNDLMVIPGGTLMFGPGPFGAAIYFDGNTTLGTVSGQFPTGVPTGAAPYTVAAWVAADTNCSPTGGWIGYGNNSDSEGNNFRLNNAFDSVWEYWYNNDFAAYLTNGTFLDQFHYVVGTWDGTNEILYLDGVPTVRNPAPSGLNVGTDGFVVGATLADDNFNGWVANLLIVNRALSADEIAAGMSGWSAVIPNPSFEVDSFTNVPGYVSQNGPITGWTAAPPDRVGLNPAGGLSDFADNGAVPDGVNTAFVQSDQGIFSALSTTIAGLVPGHLYQVTFRANCRDNGYNAPNPAISLDGGPFTPFTASPNVGGTNPYYTNTSYFIATRATAALVIANQTPVDTTVIVDNFTIADDTLPAIPNRSFEADSFTNFPGYVSGNTPITGWLVSSGDWVGLNNNSDDTPFANNGAIPSGTNVAFVQSDNNVYSTLSTTISNLVPGYPYRVRFRANARDYQGDPSATISINGGPAVPFTAGPPVGGSNPYYTNTVFFTATNATAALVIANQTTNDTTVLVDDFFASPVLPPPAFPPALSASLDSTGANIVLTVSGPPGYGYRLLTSPDPTVPVSQWTLAAAGVFGYSPDVYTNPLYLSDQQFYIVGPPVAIPAVPTHSP